MKHFVNHKLLLKYILLLHLHYFSGLVSIYKTGGEWLFGAKPLGFHGQTSDLLPAFIQHTLVLGSASGARDTALNQAGKVSAPACVTRWHVLQIHTLNEAWGENKSNKKL